MGDNLTSFGDVDRIASAFNRMDDTKLDRSKMANAMKDMKRENMNFGTLPVITANMTPVNQINNQLQLMHLFSHYNNKVILM